MKQRTTPAALAVASLFARRFAAVLLSVAVAAAVASPGVARADSTRDGQWYTSDFQLSKAHKLSQGKGVRIGVIDGGVDAKHADMDGNVEKGKSFSGSGSLHDLDGHGTATSSVLAGHGHGKSHNDGIMGIAPKATVVSTQVDFENSSGTEISEQVGQALKWLLDNDVDIISVSVSVGSTGQGDGALEEAQDKGVPVVVASGNIHKERSWGEENDDHAAWPAYAPGVIPVTGTTQNQKFWNGSIDLKDAATQPQFGLSAPGKDIPIALPNNKYDTVNGTSFSAPIVAGTLALIKSAYPDLNYDTWAARLIETVDDKGKKGYDNKYGWGIVNPYNALDKDVKYKDEYSDINSPSSDRLPLDKQGKQSDKPDGEQSGKLGDTPDKGDDNGSALSSTSSGLPLWAIVALAVAAVFLAALITTVTLKIRHNKTPTPPPGGTAPGPPPGTLTAQPGTTAMPGPPPGNMAPGHQPPPVQNRPAGHTPPGPPMRSGPPTGTNNPPAAPPGTNPQGPPTNPQQPPPGPSDGQPPPH